MVGAVLIKRRRGNTSQAFGFGEPNELVVLEFVLEL